MGDADLIHLKELKKLRELDLSATNITDAGLEHLKGLRGLRSLRLQSTKVTDDGVNRLRRARPELTVEHSVREDILPF